jgi:dGTPase
MDSISNENEQISYLRAKVINALINKSIEIYKQNFNTILEGNLDKAFWIFINLKIKLCRILKFFDEKIYNHKAVVEIENAGYNVMYEFRSFYSIYFKT